jgi:hypothetical protein
MEYEELAVELKKTLNEIVDQKYAAVGLQLSGFWHCVDAVCRWIKNQDPDFNTLKFIDRIAPIKP